MKPLYILLTLIMFIITIIDINYTRNMKYPSKYWFIGTSIILLILLISIL